MFKMISFSFFKKIKSGATLETLLEEKKKENPMKRNPLEQLIISEDTESFSLDLFSDKNEKNILDKTKSKIVSFLVIFV